MNAVRDGMKQVEAAKVFRASLRAVNKWVALDKLGGLRALKAKRRGRRTGEGALNDKQAARIYQLILGKMPDQLKLPFYLWTRAAVAQLGGGATNWARVRHHSVAEHGGAILESLGPECAAAGTTRL